MSNIYSLPISQITEVKGEFDYIGQENGKVFVRAESLGEPFSKDTIPHLLQERLDKPLREAKAKKLQELNEHCDSLLLSFKSSALGQVHIYDGKIEDQINLMGAVNLGIDMPFRCRKENEDIKSNVMHTNAQLRQVFSDSVSYKNEVVARCGALKSYVDSLESVDEVALINWESAIPSQESSQESTAQDSKQTSRAKK